MQGIGGERPSSLEYNIIHRELERRFAWFPRTLTNGKWVFWKMIYVREVRHLHHTHSVHDYSTHESYLVEDAVLLRMFGK